MCGCDKSSNHAIDTRISGVAFKVDDMTCGHCVGTIRKALETAMPGTAVAIDLESHVVTVAGDADQAETIIRDAGYAPQRLVH